MMTSKKKTTASADKVGRMSPTEQSKRFIEDARKLEVDETEAGEERAFGKVGLKKSGKKK